MATETAAQKRARLAKEAAAATPENSVPEAAPEAAEPEEAPEAPAKATKGEEKPLELAEITVKLANGSMRTYTEATHGPHFQLLARNYRVGQNGVYTDRNGRPLKAK